MGKRNLNGGSVEVVTLAASDQMKHCSHCYRPLIQIDHYGERLIGCIECNRWGGRGDATLPMQLIEDDLEAIRARAGLP